MGRGWTSIGNRRPRLKRQTCSRSTGWSGSSGRWSRRGAVERFVSAKNGKRSCRGLGFTKKSAEEFFTLLAQGGVRTLVDVRLNPNSQLAGFAQGLDLPYFLRGLAASTRNLSIKRVEQFLGWLTLVGSAPGANVAKLQPKTYGRASGLSVDSTSTRLWAIS
jgi:hypothetical protein